MPQECKKATKQCESNPFSADCIEQVNQCVTEFTNPLVGKMYWFQIRQTCLSDDEHCVELNAEAGIEPVREIMHRVYLNPETKTGPSIEETHAPVIYGYS